jgi:thiosulfate dehydrogenase (quinone) large subunit
MATLTVRNPSTLREPAVITSLFNNPAWAWLWLVARLYVGYTWLTSGLEKLENPAWTQTGIALKGFWERAILIPDAPARPLIAFSWYRTFIESLLESGSYIWFSKLIVAGELLIGIALILGLFTWFAALAGGFMNWNFMMAGSASVNPVMFTISILLLLSWKTAGWIGLDRWVLSLMPGRQRFDTDNMVREAV